MNEKKFIFKKNIHDEYKLIKKDINKLYKLKINIKKLRKNLKEIEKSNKLEKKYTKKNLTIKEKIKNIKKVLFRRNKKETNNEFFLLGRSKRI